MSPPGAQPGRRLLFWGLLLLLVASLLAASWLAACSVMGVRLYRQVKSRESIHAGKIHQFDPRLGVAPIPLARGQHLLPEGPPVPLRFDRRGYRVPEEGGTGLEPLGERPLVVTLGDSFTHGFGCRAERTYPFLIQQALGGTTHNAGVNGYGLVQIYLKGMDTIPREKPDYLVVQYSHWLVERSRGPLVRSKYGTVAVPFLVAGETGDGVDVHGPVFRPMLFSLPFSTYRDAPAGFGNLVRFLVEVAIPLRTHEAVHRAVYLAGRGLGMIPRAVDDRQQIVRFAYAGLERLCRENGARLVVVVLGGNLYPREKELIEDLPGVLVIDAQATLERLAAEAGQSFGEAYWIQRGDPPKVVDGHPNEREHRIIADEVVRAIRDNRPATWVPAGRQAEGGPG